MSMEPVPCWIVALLVCTLGVCHGATVDETSNAIVEHPGEDFAFAFDGFWLFAPACKKAPSPTNSRADSGAKLWGTENGQCAFKNPATHVPLFYESFFSNPGGVPPPSEIDTPCQQDDTMWTRSKACQNPPSRNNSMVDYQGMLWGSEEGTICAFKDNGTHKPIYYDGFVPPPPGNTSSPRPGNTSSPVPEVDDEGVALPPVPPGEGSLNSSLPGAVPSPSGPSAPAPPASTPPTKSGIIPVSSNTIASTGTTDQQQKPKNAAPGRQPWLVGYLFLGLVAGWVAGW